ncbi:hypothetical protein E3Q18_04068 [Wallemia mellicola]|nr:hypothetical protein E3Q18_04068 [Wallemia mellicola]
MAVNEEDVKNKLNILTVENLKSIIRVLNSQLKLKLRLSGNKADFVHRILDTLDHYKEHNKSNYDVTKDIVMQVYNTGTYSRPASGSGPRLPPTLNLPTKHPAYEQPAAPKPLIWKSNPFQSIIRQVSDVATLHEARDRSLRSVFLEFKIPTDYSQQLNQSRIGPSDPIRYQLRIYSASSDFYKPHLLDQQLPIDFPVLCDLKVNGKQIKANTRGVRNQPGTASPPNADVEKNLILSPNASNTLEVIYRDTHKKHYIVINLVEQYSCDQLANIVRQQPEIPSTSVVERYKSMQDNDDVVAGASTVSLKCPIGFFRMQTPIRSIHSQSLQCFDAMSFFSINEQLPTFTDPSSKKPIKFKDLAVDGFTHQILQAIPDDYGSVVVEPDAEWHTEDGEYGSEAWMEAKKAGKIPEFNKAEKQPSAKPVKNEKQEKSAEVLDLSSDDEDADGSSYAKAPPRPPAKKQQQIIDLTLSSDEEDEVNNDGANDDANIVSTGNDAGPVNLNTVGSSNDDVDQRLPPLHIPQEAPAQVSLKRNRDSDDQASNILDKRRNIESNVESNIESNSVQNSTPVSASNSVLSGARTPNGNPPGPFILRESGPLPASHSPQTPFSSAHPTPQPQQEQIPRNDQQNIHQRERSPWVPQPLTLPQISNNFTVKPDPFVPPRQEHRVIQPNQEVVHQPSFGELQGIPPAPPTLPPPTFARLPHPIYRPPSQRDNGSRYHEHHSRSLRAPKTRLPEQDKNVRRIVPSRSSLKTDEDFVPLVSQRKRAKQREAQQHGYLTLDVDYRSLEGPSKSTNADEDVNGSSDENSDEEESSKTRYNDTVKKRIEWDRHLKEHPQDVEGWLDYVKFQKDIVINENIEVSSKNVRNVVLDLQYQVLEKAITYQPNNVDLIVKKLEIGASGLKDDIVREFQFAIRRYNGVYKIWRSYIDFVQCHASIISPGEIYPNEADRMCPFEISSRVYRDAFHALANQGSDNDLINLFTRYCSFLLGAGYTERVYSLYQAVLELNSRNISVDQLGKLWHDTNFKRVGNIAEDIDEEYRLEYPEYATLQLQEWEEYEMINDTVDNSFPVVCERNFSDDPFRNVLWEVDLLPFLIKLRGVDCKEKLLDSLLSIFSISMIPNGISTNDEQVRDLLLQGRTYCHENFELGYPSYFNQPQYINTIFPLHDTYQNFKDEHLEHLQRIADDLGLPQKQMLLYQNDNSKLKQILANNVDNCSSSGVVNDLTQQQTTMNILKARRFWSSLDLSNFEAISCRALFEYLVSRSDEKAVTIFEEALNKLPASTYNHEVLLTELVCFIDSLERLHDMDRTIQLPSTSTIKRVYGNAKKTYPHNSLFRWVIQLYFPCVLTHSRYLYFNTEAKFGGYRQLFDEGMEENEYAEVYIQMAKNTLKRSEANNVPYVNKVRRIFAVGIASQKAQHSVALWKSYYEFEFNIMKDYGSAEKVVMSSLRFCPWSKELHMFIFKVSKKTQNTNHLLQIINVMSEYGIRMRIDPSPYIRRAVEFELNNEERLKAENLVENSENSEEEMFM